MDGEVKFVCVFTQMLSLEIDWRIKLSFVGVHVVRGARVTHAVVGAISNICVMTADVSTHQIKTTVDNGTNLHLWTGYWGESVLHHLRQLATINSLCIVK